MTERLHTTKKEERRISKKKRSCPPLILWPLLSTFFGEESPCVGSLQVAHGTPHTRSPPNAEPPLHCPPTPSPRFHSLRLHPQLRHQLSPHTYAASTPWLRRFSSRTVSTFSKSYLLGSYLPGSYLLGSYLHSVILTWVILTWVIFETDYLETDSQTDFPNGKAEKWKSASRRSRRGTRCAGGSQTVDRARSRRDCVTVVLAISYVYKLEVESITVKFAPCRSRAHRPRCRRPVFLPTSGKCGAKGCVLSRQQIGETVGEGRRPNRRGRR